MSLSVKQLNDAVELLRDNGVPQPYSIGLTTTQVKSLVSDDVLLEWMVDNSVGINLFHPIEDNGNIPKWSCSE